MSRYFVFLKVHICALSGAQPFDGDLVNLRVKSVVECNLIFEYFCVRIIFK